MRRCNGHLERTRWMYCVRLRLPPSTNFCTAPDAVLSSPLMPYSTNDLWVPTLSEVDHVTMISFTFSTTTTTKIRILSFDKISRLRSSVFYELTTECNMNLLRLIVQHFGRQSDGKVSKDHRPHAQPFGMHFSRTLWTSRFYCFVWFRTIKVYYLKRQSHEILCHLQRTQ